MGGKFLIDVLPERARAYVDTHVVVAIDVFRATTSIVTALDCGHEVFPVADVTQAIRVAGRLKKPILAGEQAGIKPDGFDINNSPTAISQLEGSNPIVIVSSSGTLLLDNARDARSVYVACLRNVTATAAHLARNYDRIALLGAGTKGLARAEDQIGCAWIGQRLLELGWTAETVFTSSEIERWQGANLDQLRDGPSAEYLIRTDQSKDIDFVLSHVDDISAVAIYNGERVTLLPLVQSIEAAASA